MSWQERQQVRQRLAKEKRMRRRKKWWVEEDDMRLHDLIQMKLEYDLAVREVATDMNRDPESVKGRVQYWARDFIVQEKLAYHNVILAEIYKRWAGKSDKQSDKG